MNMSNHMVTELCSHDVPICSYVFVEKYPWETKSRVSKFASSNSKSSSPSGEYRQQATHLQRSRCICTFHCTSNTYIYIHIHIYIFFRHMQHVQTAIAVNSSCKYTCYILVYVYIYMHIHTYIVCIHVYQKERVRRLYPYILLDIFPSLYTRS